jgi:toxin ParE1/3/4
MIVRFTDAAEHDLEALGDYIAQDNLKRALSFVRELRTPAWCRLISPSAFRWFPATRTAAFGGVCRATT